MVASISGKSRFRYIVRLVLANMVLAFIISVVYTDGLSGTLKDFLQSMIWGFVISITQWLGHSYFHNRLDKKYSWQDQLIKRAIFNSLAIVLYAVFAYLIVSILILRIVYGGYPDNPLQWALKSSSQAVFISFAVSVIIVTIEFFRRWKSSLLEAEKFKAEMLRYKYESLQNQINPHFLFNSFNVLSDLVYEDQKKAVNFIKQMSQLFRYVLDSRDRELVSLVEELDFTSSFAFLLQTRFEEKLTISIDANPGEGDMVVPMTMQLLIENCVKHNEISTSKPLIIKVSRNDDYIKVVNNLQFKQAGTDSKETGLSNIIQQYSYFTDKKIVIDKSEHYFSVEVPVLKANSK